jgi:hypothetical protein
MMATGAHAPASLKSSRPNGTTAVINPFRRTAEDGVATIHTGRPSKVALRRPAPVAPEKVLQAFNTWAFKREQPDGLATLQEAIAGAVQLARPVPFVLYWGKGPRCGLAEPDAACLDYLALLGSRVRQVYAPGASFKLIFTDTHATLNGHAPEAVESYFNAVEQAARERGFDGCWLSELVFAAEAAGAIDVAEEHIPDEVLQKLGACAAKWFRAEGTVEEGAMRYLQMNMIEKRSVQFAFPRSIFVTFNGSEFRSLFPDRMPIFYMYSLRRGTSVKPWFLPAAQEPVVDAPAMAE